MGDGLLRFRFSIMLDHFYVCGRFAPKLTVFCSLLVFDAQCIMLIGFF